MVMLTSLRTTVPAEAAIDQKMALAAIGLMVCMTEGVQGNAACGGLPGSTTREEPSRLLISTWAVDVARGVAMTPFA